MTVLRVFAVLIAVAAVIDPAVRLTRTSPPPVKLHLDPSDADAVAEAPRVHAALRDRVTFVDGDDAAAHVAVGRVRPAAAAFARPLSQVTIDEAPEVVIDEAPAAVQVTVNGATTIPVVLHGRGVAGRTSVVAVEDDGLELARLEHRWTADGTAALLLPYMALAPGARRLIIRVHPVDGERQHSGNQVDVLAMRLVREGRVAVIEPRPSWPAGFVRRALEDDLAFRVASMLRPTPQVTTRAGQPPRSLAFDQLMPFDVIIVGAPEELRAGEVEALRRFAEQRGGTVVFLPDRRPAGPYTQLLPSPFTEQLLAEPRVLEPAGIPASEVVSFPLVAGLHPLASLDDAPVVFSWPRGDGRILFSGALDAWRFRADARSRAATFWRDALMTAALDAPPPLRLEIAPAVVRPGGAVRLVARIRSTELAAGTRDGREGAFDVEAHVTDPRGQKDVVRLRPRAVPGVLDGTMAAAVPGVYNVTASLAGGGRSETTFVAHAEAAAAPIRSGVLEGVPELTGGVTARSADLSPLIDHLSKLARPSRVESLHPTRSGWWMALFVVLVSTEWTLRRRRGLR